MTNIQVESAETPLTTSHNKSITVHSTGQQRGERKRSYFQWWKSLPLASKLCLVLVSLINLFVLSVHLLFFLWNIPKQNELNMERDYSEYLVGPDTPFPPSTSKLHRFINRAVCSDSEKCSQIGSDILGNGGNIFDAAIATFFCVGIVAPQSMGIGGGFLANIYIRKEQQAYTLNSKEIAPLAAHPDMFDSTDEYLHSAKAIGVPGHVKGLWEMHQKYGSKPWKELLEPSIKLCENGFELPNNLYSSIVYRNDLINDTLFRKTYYINGTDEPRYDDIFRPPQELCRTHRMLAENGGDDFYNGALADLIVEDLQDLGAIITKKDLELYKTRWERSLSMPIDNDTLHVTPMPSGGALVAFMLNILRGYNFTAKSIATDEDQVQTYHRFIEASKFAFGYRSQLGDPQFENITEIVQKLLSPEFAAQIRGKINDNKTSSDPAYYGGIYDIVEDHGTSHMSIVAPNGDAISITSSINDVFGSGKTGKRTGIIFNNGMNDFAATNMTRAKTQHINLPGAPGNYVEPQKRALSSMSPTILTDANGDVRMVVGAAGGTRILTRVSMVIARMLWFGENVKEAVDARQIHHQLIPMQTEYEFGITQKIVGGLKLLGHKMQSASTYSVVCAIAKNQTELFANADYRIDGEVAGL